MHRKIEFVEQDAHLAAESAVALRQCSLMDVPKDLWQFLSLRHLAPLCRVFREKWRENGISVVKKEIDTAKMVEIRPPETLIPYLTEITLSCFSLQNWRPMILKDFLENSGRVSFIRLKKLTVDKAHSIAFTEKKIGHYLPALETLIIANTFESTVPMAPEYARILFSEVPTLRHCQMTVFGRSLCHVPTNVKGIAVCVLTKDDFDDTVLYLNRRLADPEFQPVPLRVINLDPSDIMDWIVDLIVHPARERVTLIRNRPQEDPFWETFLPRLYDRVTLSSDPLLRSRILFELYSPHFPVHLLVGDIDDPVFTSNRVAFRYHPKPDEWIYCFFICGMKDNGDVHPGGIPCHR